MKNIIPVGILTIMRIFLLFIGIGLSSVYANSVFAQNKIQIDVKNISVEEFFEEIQKSSDYVFFYKDNVLNTSKKISVKLKNAKMNAVLEKAFSNTDLSYKIIGNQVVVKKLPPISKNESSLSLGTIFQNTVSGTITDAGGQPLPGVNVLIKGSTVGTQSDFDGNYTIDIADGTTLVFSYIGMLSKKYQLIIEQRSTLYFKKM